MRDSLARSRLLVLMMATLVLCLGTSSCWSGNETQASEGFNLYVSEHPDLHFSFEYPDWWEVLPTEEYEDLMLYITLVEPVDEVEGIMASVAVFRDSSEYSPETAREHALEAWADEQDLKVLRDTTAWVDGVEWLDIEQVATILEIPLRGCGDGPCWVTLRDRELMTEHDGRTYSIHVGAGVEHYEEHLEEIKHFLMSFRFTSR